MEFSTPAFVEQATWQMRLADWPRARNRAQLNELYQGFPPYTEEEVRQNRIETNVNFLDGPEILHDARRQCQNAFQDLFTVTLDYGPVWKRREWGTIITREMTRLIKKSRKYLNQKDSTFASMVLHGIGPRVWNDKYGWCARGYGIEDILVPSNTLVDLENLPFFAVYEQYTGMELYQMTHGPRVDPGWNMQLVDQMIAWVDEQARVLNSSNWPEVWSPEKMTERIKQDGGFYASDSLPTIDTYHFYYYYEDGKRSGWKRHIVLDAWGSPGVGGIGGRDVTSTETSASQPGRNKYKGMTLDTSEFLYDGRRRMYADSIDEIIHFQFADASCVAPFRYHSVRSLGFLLYSVCHLQNRLRCKFNDALFESLIQYFRVNNPADAERLTKVDLIHMGVIPEGLNFVKPEERWQYNESLMKMGFDLNQGTMQKNSASFTQDFDFGREKAEETATRTMAKVNSTAALVGAMLNKAYNLEAFQYGEVARRFCLKNSTDMDVRRFQLECLKAGVPRDALNSERWDVQPVRVIGSGNKMLQVAMADKLMALAPRLDPDAQKEIYRLYVLANSDDPALTQILVPEVRRISNTVHDAQNSLGTLLSGMPVSVVDGENHTEIIEVWLHALALLVKRIDAKGKVPDPMDMLGANNLIAHIQQHIKLLAQDKTAKQAVRQYGDDLKNLANEVKAAGQRLAEKMQSQNGGGAQMSPEAAAKIKATEATAASKIKIQQQSAAQKTAQKQISFEQKVKQDHDKHRVELAHHDIELAQEVARNRLRSFSE